MRYVVVRCNAVVAWFMLEGDRDFCYDKLAEKDRDMIYTKDKIDVGQLDGIRVENDG